MPALLPALKTCACGHAPDVAGLDTPSGSSTSIYCANEGCDTPLSVTIAGANHAVLAAEAWNALRSVPERRSDGTIKWAQPGDKPHRVWAIQYDDQDRRVAYFDGPDAEAMAREQYERSWPDWNCYLLATVPHKISSRASAASYAELKAAAVAAVNALADWCHNEEAQWSGWGDQIIPQHATDRRVQATTALAVLEGRFEASPVLAGIIDAWEKVQGGKNHPVLTIQNWLVRDMAPAIDAARRHLNRLRPDGSTP